MCMTVTLNRGEVAQGRHPALEGLGPTCAACITYDALAAPLGQLLFRPWATSVYPTVKMRGIYYNLSPFHERKKRGKRSYCGKNYERGKESKKIKKFLTQFF